MAISLPSSPPLTIATTTAADTGVIADQTDDGATRLRALYAATQYDISLQWDSLEVSGKNTIETFFETYKTTEIDVVVAGKTYRGRVTKAPAASFDSAQNLHRLTATLRGPRV